MANQQFQNRSAMPGTVDIGATQVRDQQLLTSIYA